jgi:hypothetical protein
MHLPKHFLYGCSQNFHLFISCSSPLKCKQWDRRVQANYQDVLFYLNLNIKEILVVVVYVKCPEEDRY